MSNWMIGAAIAAQGLVINESTGQIETSIRFAKGVDACIVESYEPCAGGMCYDSPEGTFAVLVAEKNSSRTTVLLYVKTYGISDRDESFRYYSLHMDKAACVSKAPYEAINFGALEKPNSDGFYSIWIK